VKLTFFDTETTGLPDKEPFLSSPELGPEITEYAIADWEDGEVTAVVHKLIMPKNSDGFTVDAEGTARTLDGFPMSFRPDAWQGRAVHWNKTDDQTMRERLTPNYLAGSNPTFDCDRVWWEMKRGGAGGKKPGWSHRVINTASIGALLWIQGKVEKTGLGYLAKFFGVDHDAHTSLGDVRAAITVWERMHDEFVYKPKRWAEALAEIAKHSPDASMAEFAAEELAAR